jgi:hypothetical protein
VSNARKPVSTPISTDPVFEQEMTAINADLDAIANKRHNAVARHK